ncbi:MAG TPA: HAD-IIB family hydrolase [Steroidobacter sp.]|uniref:HAD-IIB family hydrolase n=1 Tax=Steroidobacter sp. TaxID=1978227 RepID=UPI002ED8F553
MRYLALCTDYDGTIARHGVVDDLTIDALARLRESGRKLVMVTGRELPDLFSVFQRLDLFDLVVAENGALLYNPQTKEEKPLCEPPPPAFVAALQARNVARLSVGRTIVATWEPHERDALEVIRDLGLELQVIFNKGAVMILPSGVNKATGLKAALTELNLSVHNAVGVGDAENDHAFLGICECAVAVANALPSVQEKADFVTRATHGPGVTQLIDEMIADDLMSREPSLRRHRILLGKTYLGEPVHFSPHGVNALIVGTSGGGKSTVAAGLVERLCQQQYTFCIVDPEGDYDSVESAVVLGSAEHPPEIEECEQLLCKPDENAVINLMGVKLNDRPWFFMTLFARLRDLRARTGRPHWLIVDEAHHVLPSNWQPSDVSLPEVLEGVLLVSVTPSLLAKSLLRAVDTLVILGDKPRQMLHEFTQANKLPMVDPPVEQIEAGDALLWSRTANAPPLLLKLEPSKVEHRRHLRKYAEGELPEDRSFFFRGPQGKLKLRAPNLITFMELGDGVDDDTWLFHLQRHEVSQWLREAIKDEELADKVAEVENEIDNDADASRKEVRKLIEAVYTLPASTAASARPSK